jgi:hypothetical protein
MSPSRRTPRPRPRAAQLLAVIVLFGVGACGGGAGIGEHCDSLSECASHLQCVNHTCVPRCDRHADCGDGHVCRDDGICEVVVSEIDDYCEREIDCGPGHYCRLDDTDPEQDGVLAGSCQEEQSGGVLDAECTGATQADADAQCRQGTCALGRCVFMCVDQQPPLVDTDCPAQHVCSSIPRQLAPLPAPVPSFFGCLPDRGDIVYRIPTDQSFESIMLPVPGIARSFALVMSVGDSDERIGAVAVRSPSGEVLYPAPPTTREEYFANPVRHEPQPGIATLLMPQRPPSMLTPFEKGAYFVDVWSFGEEEIPQVEVVYKLDEAVHLDLHLYFLDLTTHPCPRLDSIAGDEDQFAADFAASPDFQDEYLGELDSIFSSAGLILDLSEATYTDITGRGDLDGLDESRLDDLLALSSHEAGVHVFFVRSISPAGIEGLVGGPPVPPGRPGTRSSGVAIATDTLCYADWKYLARTTAHEIARALGLQRSVEPDGYEDQIGDSTYETNNLMYFSDRGDEVLELSAGQKAVLRLNPVLH